LFTALQIIILKRKKKKRKHKIYEIKHQRDLEWIRYCSIETSTRFRMDQIL